MNVTPIQLFPGYSVTATEITIPLSALSDLSPTEADAVTGNGMEVLRSIVDKATTILSSLAPEARPTKSTSVKTAPTIAFGANLPAGTLRQGYTLSFDLVPTGLEPAAE